MSDKKPDPFVDAIIAAALAPPASLPPSAHSQNEFQFTIFQRIRWSRKPRASRFRYLSVGGQRCAFAR